MMIKHDLGKSPGRWRAGPILVRDERTDNIVYAAPEHEEIPRLIASMLIDANADGAAEHVLIRGAMAHLNLVMIHPYRDGNGRMGRCLQTLVLARDQIVAPIELYGFDRVSDLVASRDLRALCDARLLTPIGEKRGRYYLADTVLTQIALNIRRARPPRSDQDPFPHDRPAGQLSLEGVALGDD